MKASLLSAILVALLATVAAASPATWEDADCVAENLDGQITLADGVVFRCPVRGTLGRVCEFLEPGDCALFAGTVPPIDADDQRWVVRQITVGEEPDEAEPPEEPPGDQDPPGDGDGRGRR